jgi:hypothetical protein
LRVLRAGGFFSPSTAILLIALAFLYTGFNTAFRWDFREKPHFMNYNMLAEAFLAGQLHLQEKVDPNRLQSKDPLDPRSPGGFILDAALWKGKYYFMHEPLPALVHALWIRVMGKQLQTGVAVVVVLLANALWVGALLWTLRQSYWPQSPEWIYWYTWLSFCLSGVQVFLASRPAVYHEAIAMASFFVLGGTYFLLRALVRPESALSRLAFAGAFFGAAACCRPLVILYALSAVIVFLVFARRDKMPLRNCIERLFVFLVPFSCFVEALLVYNYMRFGHFFDFGRAYGMFPQYVDYLYLTLRGHAFRLIHVPYNLVTYLFSLPQMTETFPFVHWPHQYLWDGEVYVVRENVCSIFVTVPILALLFFACAYWRNKLPRSSNTMYVFCLLGPLVQFSALLFFVRATTRFMYDFVPLLFVPVFCNIVALCGDNPAMKRYGRPVYVLLAVLFFATVYMGLAAGLRGVEQELSGR